MEYRMKIALTKFGLKDAASALARIVYAGTLAFILSGCETIPERNPLPPELTKQASIPGVPEARFWADEWPKYSLEKIESYTDADYRRYYPGIYDQPHNYLAISGGGADGASE
jgi:hypothetical protein